MMDYHMKVDFNIYIEEYIFIFLSLLLKDRIGIRNG